MFRRPLTNCRGVDIPAIIASVINSVCLPMGYLTAWFISQYCVVSRTASCRRCSKYSPVNLAVSQPSWHVRRCTLRMSFKKCLFAFRCKPRQIDRSSLINFLRILNDKYPPLYLKELNFGPALLIKLNKDFWKSMNLIAL